MPHAPAPAVTDDYEEDLMVKILKSPFPIKVLWVDHCALTFENFHQARIERTLAEASRTLQLHSTFKATSEGAKASGAMPSMPSNMPSMPSMPDDDDPEARMLC